MVRRCHSRGEAELAGNIGGYESWALPIAVIGTVPIAIFSALAVLWLAGLGNNIYVQMGLVLLIGLSTKTAILIVEFAIQLREYRMSVAAATNKAAVLLFIAVLMTAWCPSFTSGFRCSGIARRPDSACQGRWLLFALSSASNYWPPL